jgi:hypothetical protein
VPTSPSTRDAEGVAVSGILTNVGATTARIAAPRGSVAIAWGPGTVIVDSQAVKASDIGIGSCVLVLPPAGGPAPTATSIVAGLVRVVPSSPSCPFVPRASPTPGTKPSGTVAGGSVTVVAGQGVLGTVMAVSSKGLTLKSGTGRDVRTVAVTTSPATQYRKPGDHPRVAVVVGRCATVWGTAHAGARLLATRIQVSDPVGGNCAPVSGD